MLEVKKSSTEKGISSAQISRAQHSFLVLFFFFFLLNLEFVPLFMFPQPLKGCSDIAFPCPAEISSNSTEAKEPLGGGIRVRSWSVFMVGR